MTLAVFEEEVEATEITRVEESGAEAEERECRFAEAGLEESAERLRADCKIGSLSSHWSTRDAQDEHSPMCSQSDSDSGAAKTPPQS